MKIRTKLVRLFGYFCVGVGALVLIGALIACLVFWATLGEMLLWKKILIEILLVFAGLAVFLTSIGLYEHLETNKEHD